MGHGTAFSKMRADLLGNQKFETGSIQRRVLWEPVAADGCRPLLGSGNYSFKGGNLVTFKVDRVRTFFPPPLGLF